jgi:hypothetical protein
MRLTSLVALVSVGLLGAAASAQVCDRAVALRVNKKGLELIAKEVKALVPSAITIPAASKVVVDWPLTSSDATVVTSEMTAEVTIQKLELTMAQGALRLKARADISTGGPLTVENPYVGLGSADCTAALSLKDLSIDLGLQLAVSSSRVSATVTQASISFDNDASVIALKGCALGNVLTSVVSFLRSHFGSTIQSKLETIAKQKIPTLIQEKLSSAIEVSSEVQGMTFTGRLETIATDTSGLYLELGAGVSASTSSLPSCLLGATMGVAPACGSEYVELSSSVDAMFGAGVTASAINQTLYAAWRTGKLCVTSDQVSNPAVAAGLGKVAAALGQPASTKVSFSARLLSAPRVEMSKDSGIALVLAGLELKLALTTAAGVKNALVVSADLSAAALPLIDPTANSVSLDLTKVSVSRLELQNQDGTASTLSLDPARLTRFVSDVVVPVVRGKLLASPISPSVVNAKALLVELKAVTVGSGYVAAYVDGYVLESTGDKTAPQTTLVKSPGAVVGPQVISFVVAGSDNETPSSLLRFKARVDGGTWSTPAYGGHVDVTTYRGTHTIEIAAVDHEGNTDPSPLRVQVLVDDVAPQLLVTSQPDPLVEDSSVEVGFDGRDDRTAADKLAFAVELYGVPEGGGTPTLLETATVAAGARTARLEGLADGIYKARVIVKDQAGNVTSEDVGFVVASSGGCSTAHGPASLAPFGLALVLALLVAARARARRTRA